VSHDLRTPLTRLRLRIERLPEPAAHAASADIREMNELIDASLAVMREQSGGAPPSVLDLSALLQALVDDLADQGQVVDLASPLPVVRVQVHPATLRRVVGNLVGNALRYGQRAWSVWIWVRTRWPCTLTMLALAYRLINWSGCCSPGCVCLVRPELAAAVWVWPLRAT
jgi:signal transduction histidine kinase